MLLRHISINVPQNSKKAWLESTWSSNQHLLERDVDVHHGDAVYHHGEDVPMKQTMEAAEGLLSFAAVCAFPVEYELTSTGMSSCTNTTQAVQI